MNNYRMTTAKNLQQVINDGLVSVVDVQVEDKETDEVKEITAEQFCKDLDSYINSGIFSESLDFRYDITGPLDLNVRIGHMSLYCNNSITVTLCLCDDSTMEQVKDRLSKVIFS